MRTAPPRTGSVQMPEAIHSQAVKEALNNRLPARKALLGARTVRAPAVLARGAPVASAERAIGRAPVLVPDLAVAIVSAAAISAAVLH